MKYQIGKTGRIILAKFDDGDDVLAGLQKIARDEDIRAAVFHLVGGMKEGKFVVGPESEEMPPRPVWRELGESHEILGTGTIFWESDLPKIHFHGAFGKHDMVKVGCLRDKASTFLVLEAVITELIGINAVREVNPAIGTAILKLQ